MALDKSRGFYPIDGNGKITVQDIINEVDGSGGGGEITVSDVEGLQAILTDLTTRLENLEA